MVRGVIPRQPAKSGGHEGTRSLSSGAQSRGSSREKAFRGAHSSSLGRQVAQAPTHATPKPSKAAKGYDPLAPRRIQEIMKRLDQLYLDVPCALTQKNAWDYMV